MVVYRFVEDIAWFFVTISIKNSQRFLHDYEPLAYNALFDKTPSTTSQRRGLHPTGELVNHNTALFS